MSLTPCLTNADINTPLFALSGQGGGGGGGGGSTIITSTIQVNTITGNPSFEGSAFYLTQPNAGNDGITFVANPPSPISGVQPSTVGMRFDMGGQVGYILQNPTAGVGPGNGLQINANGITLGSSQGVEIAGVNGNGAGSLTVSSLTVSSINGATPGGGGGALAPIAFQCSTNTYFAPSDGLIPIGKLSTIPGHLYQGFLQIDTVSSFATPAADDRITLVDPATSIPYCQSYQWWASTLVHNPRGDSASFQWKADNTSTSVFHVYSNGGAPSTLFTTGNGGVMYITDLGVPT